MTARRILFLDVDGVLNHLEWMRRDRDGLVGPFRRGIDPLRLRLVNEICAETGAAVVVSSTWRILHSLTSLRRGFRSLGGNFHVLSKTPHNLRRRTASGLYLATQRGHEIQHWLDHHAPVESLAIVDDDSDMAHLARFHVKTSFAVGLTRAGANRLVELLRTPWEEVRAA